MAVPSSLGHRSGEEVGVSNNMVPRVILVVSVTTLPFTNTGTRPWHWEEPLPKSNIQTMVKDMLIVWCSDMLQTIQKEAGEICRLSNYTVHLFSSLVFYSVPFQSIPGDGEDDGQNGVCTAQREINGIKEANGV